MTTAIIAKDIQFSIGDGADPEVFTAVAEVTDMTPPSDTLDVIDATHLNSPLATREFIQGLNDPGECTFEMAFVPGATAGDAAIRALKNAGTKNFRITWEDNSTWTFAGFLTNYAPTASTGEKMSASVTIKVTSSYTVAAAV